MLPHPTLTNRYANTEGKSEFVNQLFDKGARHYDGIVDWGFLGRVYPFLSGLFTRSHDARDMMRYYWETMDACVPPASVLEALRSAGLVEVKRNSPLGLFSEYTAVKP